MKKRHTGIRNYYIYEDGTVVNEDSGKTLKPFNSGNYLKIELKVAPGVPKKFFIHRLVYKAFIGDLIDGMVVEHLDGNPQNNHYTNLKQSTQQQKMICLDVKEDKSYSFSLLLYSLKKNLIYICKNYYCKNDKIDLTIENIYFKDNITLKKIMGGE